jgi:hypothetical protein
MRAKLPAVFMLALLSMPCLMPAATLQTYCEDQEPVDDYIYTECCYQVVFCRLYWGDHVYSQGVNTYVMSSMAVFYCDSDCSLPECGGWGIWYVKYNPFNC